MTIISSFDQPTRAEVTMPAYSELMYLGDMDRVPVHVFVRETMVESPNFILMFEGYITDTSYANNAIQRAVMVTAVSILDILEDVRIKFLTQLEHFAEPMLKGESDLAMIANGSMLNFPLYLLMYGLVDVEGKNKGDPCNFPTDYLENVYAFIQKAQPAEKQEEQEGAPLGSLHASALTTYYGKYARDIALLNRFERLPYFDKPGSDGKYAWESGEVTADGPDKQGATIFPMMYGMRQNEAVGLLAQSISNIPRQMTAAALLSFLINQMEYEYLFITNPAYHSPPKPKKPETPEEAQTLKNAEKGEPAQVQGQAQEDDKKKKEKKDRLVCSCLKPLLNDSLPPGCNVAYRSMVTSVSATIRHKGVPTRIRVYDPYDALARLTQGTEASGLAKFGLLTYYPSARFEKFDQENTIPPYLNPLNSELLEVEQFTGPWVRELEAPPWFFYLKGQQAQEKKDGEFSAPEQNSGAGHLPGQPEMTLNGNPVSSAQVFKERFLRRQLLNSKYFLRQLEFAEIFDPYITPGFPGVVFDSGDSGFAYAGHVLSVTHSISPQDVSTRVGMNFVRPLAEAAQIEIPNPLVMVQQLTHDVKKLSEVYAAILGSPGNKMPGAEAKTFAALEEMCDCSSEATEPNNNPREAYRQKRRNICTFDDYLTFMGFSATTGLGPEGPNTPIKLTGKFLEDRRKLEVYEGTGWEARVPQKEKIIAAALAEAEKKKEEEQKTLANVKSEEELRAEEAKKAEEEKKKKKRTKTTIDVRKLLSAIAEREFSRLIYK